MTMTAKVWKSGTTIRCLIYDSEIIIDLCEFYDAESCSEWIASQYPDAKVIRPRNVRDMDDRWNETQG